MKNENIVNAYGINNELKNKPDSIISKSFKENRIKFQAK